MAWYDRLLFWRLRRGRKLQLLRETQAMAALAQALEGLPPESRDRVLAWLMSVYPSNYPSSRQTEAPRKPIEALEASKPRTPVTVELVQQAEPSVPPEPKANYRQRRRKTSRRKL